MVETAFRFLRHLPRNLAIAVISFYQATLSPDHGPLKHLHPYGFCGHEPTCSEYGKLILKERGFTIGSILLIYRILSCHPWKRVSDEKMRKVAERALHSDS